jgi:2-C-methyl-D-erythritol 4-phosphate cytidylyltransferase
MVVTKTLILPAAGVGKRMQRETPKPYLKLGAQTILGHTIRRFLPLQGLRQILVATSKDYLEAVDRILREVVPDDIAHESLIGGIERQDSIYNALQKTADVDLVMVHDAVRPFVKLKHIETACKVAAEVGAAVLGVPAKDTIKKVDDQHFVVETPSRKYLWQAQTPQIFNKELLLKAYEKAREDKVSGTDDASLVERLGHDIKMVKGSRSNFKITYPLDLEMAKLLIEKE